MPQPLTKHGALKRRSLLDAARRVVSDGGFRRLQMTVVAEAAGTAVGTIYRYFPAKADLCAALVAEVSSRELAVLSDVAKSGATPPVALFDAVAVFAHRALADRRLAYAMIAEPVEPAVDAERLIWRTRIGQTLAEVIGEGTAAGAFRPCDPRLAASCITGAFMEALVGPLSPSSEARDAKALSDEIATLCLFMLSPSPLRDDDNASLRVQ